MSGTNLSNNSELGHYVERGKGWGRSLGRVTKNQGSSCHFVIVTTIGPKVRV